MLCFRAFLVIVNTYVSVVELTRALPARVVARTARDTRIEVSRVHTRLLLLLFICMIPCYCSGLSRLWIGNIFLKAIVRSCFAVVLAMPAAPAAAVTVALPPTSLRRIGQTEFVASVVGKARPRKWKLPTLLLRFVEANGAQTVFIVMTTSA